MTNKSMLNKYFFHKMQEKHKNESNETTTSVSFHQPPQSRPADAQTPGRLCLVVIFFLENFPHHLLDDPMEGLVQVQLGPGKLECRALFFLESQTDGPGGDPGGIRGKDRFLQHPLELLQILGPVILAQKGDGFRFHAYDVGILHMIVGLDEQQGIIQDLVSFVSQRGKQDCMELEPLL